MRKDRYIYLFTFIAAIAYAIAYAPYGFGDTDQGFIQALSWRILQGEIPYLDFTYVRPPVGLYFHAGIQALLPTQWEMLGERSLFFLLMGATVAFSTASLHRYFTFSKLALSPSAFALLAFFLSVHNYPPMAWHTVDGLFFGSLGFWFLTRGKSSVWTSLGLLAMILAALTKQAFYPMPLLGLALIALLHGSKFLLRPLLLNLLLLLSAGILIWLLAPDFLSNMWHQISGSSSLSDLVEAGLEPYLKPLLIIVLPLLLCWQAMSLYKWRLLPAGVFWAVFIGLLGLHVWRSWDTGEYVGPSFGLAQAFWLLGIGLVFKSFWVNNRAYGLLGAMLLMAWCAGISWGYATPMLYFGPILFAFLLGLKEELDFQVPRYFFGILGIYVVWVFAMLYQFPYRDETRLEQTYDLGTIFPKLEGIYAGPEMLDKSEELTRLHQEYPGSFTVLPAFPLAHYLLDEQNPLSVDWAHNVECQYEEKKDELWDELQQTEFVFLQLDKQTEWSDSSRYGCLLAKEVRDRRILLKEGKYFAVYGQ